MKLPSSHKLDIYPTTMLRYKLKGLIMKNIINLLFVSVIPTLLGILFIVIENMFPRHLYALKGIGILVAYMLIIILPIAIKMTGNRNIHYVRWPTWL